MSKFFDISHFVSKSHINKEKPRQKPWFLWLRRQDSRVGFAPDLWICLQLVRSRLRCPKKSSGLRFSSIFSTAALKAPALHLPPAAGRGFDPTSYARRPHNPVADPGLLCKPEKKKRPPGWVVFSFSGCGGRTRTYALLRCPIFSAAVKAALKI